MPNLTIVAIPSENDYVWKISSEKIPHMTLLFLGEIEAGPELARIETFVEHVASTSLHKFYLEVDHRGTLGPLNADVLFFKKNRAIDGITAARLNMLANDDIRNAYNSTEQFPEWTPHLTLGYPTSPAHEDTRDYPGFSYVNFDSLALWVSDFDGPTYQLADQGMDYDNMAMSDITAESILEHHGVKGMKWGVRKAEKAQSQADRTAAYAKRNPSFKNRAHADSAQYRADKARRKVERSSSGERGPIRRGATKANTALNAGVEVINEGEKKLIFLPREYRNQAASATQNRVLGVARTINKKPEYHGKDLKKHPDLKKAYHEEVRKEAEKIYKHELSKARTDLTLDFIDSFTSKDHKSVSFTAPHGRVRHSAEDGEILLTLVFDTDELDQITGVTAVDPFVTHDAITSEYILEHHGVKGMKWGVRRDGTTSEATVSTGRRGHEPQDIEVRQKPGQFVRTKGGSHQTASEDAIRIAAGRQLAKRSTTDALSTKQLQEAVTRMNLEQQYSKLARQSDRRARGRRVIDALLGTGQKYDTVKKSNQKNNTSVLLEAAMKSAASKNK